MDVLRSLYTPGYLVRTRDGRHGEIAAFDARQNVCTVQFGASGPFADIHFIHLMAGNDASEQHAHGCVTSSFPKGEPRSYGPQQATPDGARSMLYERTIG